ncbi:MAG TPA: hypothetical protein PKW98_06575 [Candidatus Wallbacteria bacterium]|nr:MAG: hypothetical protein BWY32_00484 [bacterium ADurb.Bin243]HPG57464.1 hypothetical protein [Candidatus Wallbacteria bacterium]
MKKIFKSSVVFMLFFILFSVQPSYSGTAEVDTLFNETVAAGGAYEQTLGENPVAAAASANAILVKFNALTAEDQAAYAQKLGIPTAGEVKGTLQSKFIDRAYEVQWNKITAEWTTLMQAKKYDEAKTYASQVEEFLKNNAAQLPGISAEMSANYKKLSQAGMDIAAAHNDASGSITEVAGLYAEKKYKETIEKIQQYAKKAADDKNFGDALKNLIPEAADLAKYTGDLTKAVVKDYAVAQVNEYNRLISEGKMKEASKLASETAAFLKGNQQAKEIVEKEYGVNSLLICERASLDSFFKDNQDIKNAMAMYPEFKEAVEKYDRLGEAKDYLGAAKLASEWAKKCLEDANFKGVNTASGGVLLEICQKGAEAALLTGIDEAAKAFCEAFQSGDMVKAKQLADAVAEVLKAYPEYKKIVNEKLGADWEKIANDASALTVKELAARDAKVAVLAETYKQIANLYSAEVAVGGTVSVMAQAFNQALNTFAQQNSQYMAEIEKKTGIKLDALFGATASGAPAGNNAPGAQQQGEQPANGQQQSSGQAEQAPGAQSGTPPVTNQSEGTNQGNPFTSGSGN